MNKKVTDAKSKLGYMKTKAIGDMALAIVVWISLLFYTESNAITAGICLIILGAYLLGTGIQMLRLKGKLAEALKGIDHNEADEQLQEPAEIYAVELKTMPVQLVDDWDVKREMRLEKADRGDVKLTGNPMQR